MATLLECTASDFTQEWWCYNVYHSTRVYAFINYGATLFFVILLEVYDLQKLARLIVSNMELNFTDHLYKNYVHQGFWLY